MRGGHNKTHGHTLKTNGKCYMSSTYSTWSNMIQRCTNKNRPDYPYYGGRGITVCDGWRKFENFLKDMGVKPIGLSIDRIDVNGPYNMENCRWTDRKTQRMNQRKITSKKRFLGVNKSSPNTWRVYCKRKYLGSFESEVDAAVAYNIEAIKQFGELAQLNNLGEK